MRIIRFWGLGRWILMIVCMLGRGLASGLAVDSGMVDFFDGARG